ncbi:hypothetical protein W822_01050 [Advenella kashmirensis W13003]|uniref:Uncharacterized protein n=1 Tax=Advenella kashmirensis W13003 TaxID=1424334 RepID=V8QXJ5_9BURK|nr:hypothetical protein [Advenella kashmirensis]ETF04636.1 hypothetical protein W822_01050 [Advenella kashmirensis W13003]
MSFVKPVFDPKSEVMDGRSLSDLTLEQYKGYISEYLLKLNSRGVLLSEIGKVPLAATTKQIDELMNHLQLVRLEMEKFQN